METEVRIDLTAEQLAGEPLEVRSKRALEPGDVTSPTTEAMFIEPLSALAMVSVAMLAERIVRHWIRKDEHGTQIDLTQDPVVVSRLAGVPMGYLVIITPDKQVETRKLDYEDESTLAAAIADVLRVFGASG